MSEPLAQVKLLIAAIRKRAEGNHLELQNVALIPGEEGEPDFIQVAMIIKPEALETLEETEQRQTDDAFASLMSGIDLSGFDSEVPESVQTRVADAANEILGDYGDQSDASEDGDGPEPTAA